MLKSFLKQKLSVKNRLRLRNFVQDLRALWCGGNLNRLGQIYGTDKITAKGKEIGHFYTPHYMTHFRKFKYKRINLLEIGVGGDEDPYRGGNSLRMWKRYFPFGRIYSIDIYDKSALEESRVKIFQGNQVDREFLEKVVAEIGDIDIIIDDGSHMNEHVIESFKILFPKLKDGGIYVVEDTQTSYWPEYGGDSENLNNPKCMVPFFKNLIDSLNHKEFIRPGYEPTYYDQHIVSMHFYHNLIFIYKGRNDEESNLVVNNQFRQK